MVNEDIFGGLRSALAKGESLRQAMISFYNAGYTKQEVEEAAAALQTQPPIQPIQPITPTIPQPGAQPTQPIQVLQPVPQPISQVTPQVVQQMQPFQPPMAMQRVSAYGKPKTKGKGLTIILIFVLLLLIGSLVLVFVFKDQIVGLLNKLF